MGKFKVRDPVAYLIAFEGDNGKRNYHGSSMYNGQAALRYYMSPFDALIDISLNPAAVVEPGNSITVHPVEALRPHTTKASGGPPVIACLHLAWRARSGKVMVRPDGTPDSVLSTSPELESGKTILELPPALLRVVDAIHDHAGLFAWKETVSTFENWSKSELEVLGQQAWQSVPLIESAGPDPDFDQFALYDPEFRQWHFVSALEVMAHCAAADVRH